MPTTDRKCGRYVLLDPIGRGGMGVVYRAEDPWINRTVAVKVLHTRHGLSPEQADLARERFAREGQVAGSIDHPNTVRVYDIGEDETTREMYIVMEFCSGRNLETILGQGPVELVRAVALIGQIASGLDAAHARGIVHRDIKPSNILVAEDGTVKVADFGITHVGTSALTLDMKELGTPAYMSPEQVSGKPLDSRADLFSLGVLSYEILAGRKPFDGDDAVSIAHAIAYSSPLPISASNPRLPEALDSVLARALAKNPTKRFGSCREFHEALRACLPDRRAHNPLQPVAKATRRRAAVWGLSSAALLAAAVVLLAWSGQTGVPTKNAPPPAAPVPKAIAPPPKSKADQTKQKPAPARTTQPSQPTKRAPEPRKPPSPAPAPAPPRAASERPPADVPNAKPKVAKATVVPPPAAKASVTIKFGHRMRRGTLVVLLDGEAIFDEQFSKPRMVLTQTTIWDPLNAPAGEHMLRARVTGDNGKTYVSAFYKVEFPQEQAIELRIDLKGDMLTVKQGAG